jgi:DNA-binding transcriptional LysR family regulator
VARLRNVSQPSLTRALAGIEARLGATLFDRSRRGLEQTDVCRAAIAKGRDILAQMEAVNASMFELRGGRATALRIAAGPHAFETVLAPAAARFAHQHPAVQIKIDACTAIDAVRKLRERRADMAVGEISEFAEPEELTIVLLLRHPFVFAVRPDHPLVHPGRQPSLPDILSHPVVATSYLATRIGLKVAIAREAARAAGGHEAFPAIVLEPVTAGPAIAAQSDVVAGTTAPDLAPALRAGDLVPVSWHEPWLVANFGIVRLRGQSAAPAAAALMDEMLAVDEEGFSMASALLPDLFGSLQPARALLGQRLEPARP